MDQTGELDVARFNALRQALFSARSAELQRWAEDVLGERLSDADDGDETALAKLLFGECRQRSAMDALYDAVARERSALRHAATSGLRTSQRTVAKSLGPYVLRGVLGQENSSNLFSAERDGALVRLRVRGSDAESRRSAWQRFVRVARVASKLDQPALPALLDSGSYAGLDVVAHRFSEGVTVAKTMADSGAMGLEEAWPLLGGVLDALQALHDAGLAHGSLHEHNVLLTSSGNAVLLDAGSHFLRARRPQRDWPLHVLSSLAPELLRGEDPSPQGDLYAFGVLLYRLLSGDGPFAGLPRHELFAAQLGRDPDPLSFLTRTGSSVQGLDELGLELLDKDPRQRPQRVTLVRQRLLDVMRSSRAQRASFSDQLLDERTCALLEEPTSLVAAAVLEASVDQGADMLRVAEALLLAADQLGDSSGTETHHVRLNLRAAALFDRAGQRASAESAYRAVLTREPRNQTARSELERTLREGGRHEQLVELFLEQLEVESEPPARARVLTNVGQLFEDAMGDGEQALLAYVQALAADAHSDRAAEAIERLAGSDTARWSRVLEDLEQSMIGAEPVLFVRMGKWYQERLLRPEAALSCFQAALERDPHDGAALLSAAILLEDALGQAPLARELYARIFATNAAHVQACRGLARLAQRAGDYAGAIDCLERHLAATQGSQQRAEAKGELETLRQLETLYRVARRPEALEKNLLRQLELAESPRQNVELLLKLATFVEQELMAEERAASLLEDALLLEPDNLTARRSLLRLYERAGVDKPGLAARALEHWQRILEQVPDDEPALRAVAARGDAAQAARALYSLGRRALQPARRAELWLQAAQRFEASADLHAARQRYQQVLQIEPRKAEAWAGLRRIALACNDTATAIKLVDRELACSSSPAVRARLYVELANIHRSSNDEGRRAEVAAERALELDECSAEAHAILADCAFEAARFADARYHYERALSQPQPAVSAELARLHAFHATCLSELGLGPEALAAAEACVELGCDPANLLRVVEVFTRNRQHERALWLCCSLLGSDELSDEIRARALSCQGEALICAGDVNQAALCFERSAALAPESTRALEALAKLHREQQDWAALVESLEALANRTKDERRWALLAEAGELALQRLCDAPRALALYELVLSEHRHDHRVLVDLLGLYGDTERWPELLPVIDELSASLAAEQRVPHLVTAARILDEKLNRPGEALSYLERALELAPDNVEVVERMQRLARAMGKLGMSEELYGRLIELALAAGDKRRVIKLLEECYQLLGGQGNPAKTLALCERAHAIDPANKLFSERLTRLYRAEPRRHLQRAIELQRERLAHDPTQAEPYQVLLELYGKSGQPDAAWCVAQALVLMSQADPEGAAIFRRHQPRNPPSFSLELSAADWQELVCHPEVDPAIGQVFALIEPALRRSRGSSAVRLGLKPEMRIDPDQHDGGVLGALKRLAPVFGTPLPELYLNKGQKRALAMVRSHQPCLVLGPSALSEQPPFQVTFTAGSHLLHFRPGYGLRHLLASARALKAAFLGALKLGAPEVTIAADVADSVEETIGVLRQELEPEVRRRLNELVADVLGRGVVDLNRWLHGVDLMSDRLGFIASNDLGTALSLVRAADEGSNSAPRGERCRELVRYAVDPSYIALRARLGLSIQAQDSQGQSPAA